MACRKEDNKIKHCPYPDDDLRRIVQVLNAVKGNLEELAGIVPDFDRQVAGVQDAITDMLSGVWKDLWKQLDGYTDEEFESFGLDSRNIPREMPIVYATRRPVPTNPATKEY